MKHRKLLLFAIGIALAAVAAGTAFRFDDTVQDFFAQRRDPAVFDVMRTISRFGDWWSHAIVGVALLAIAWWRGNKNWTRIFLSMLIALALAGIIGRGVKIATGRARPNVSTEQSGAVSHFSSKYHAFPSGHVAASMGFFGVLLIVKPRIGLACLPIPILIGFSRIYLGAHYLSDVVCAAILGAICSLIVARWLLSKSNIEHQTSDI